MKNIYYRFTHLHSSSQVSKSLYFLMNSIYNNFFDVNLSFGFLLSIEFINSLNYCDTSRFSGKLIDYVAYFNKYFTILYKSDWSFMSKGEHPI